MKRLSNWLRVGEPANTRARWAIGGIALAVFGCGMWWHNTSLIGVGAVTLVAFLRFCWPGPQPDRARDRVLPKTIDRQSPPTRPADSNEPLPKRWLGHPEFSELPESTDALVEDLLATGRYALLLRPEMNRHLDREHITRAVRYLDD